MFYEDLSPYSYSTDLVVPQIEEGIIYKRRTSIVNIGWLDNQHPFITGFSSELFLDKLFKLYIIQRKNGYRGFHVCQLCHTIKSSSVTLKNKGQEITIDLPDPMIMEKGGRTALIGSREILVHNGKGIVYVAPNMICHYVAEHNYLPPQEFIHAVLEINQKYDVV